MERAGTTERAGTAGRAAPKLTNRVPTSKRGTTSEPTHNRPVLKPRPTPEIPNKGSVSKSPVEAPEPGAGPDEQPAGEVLGTVVPVRCTGVGIISIITVRAYRWRAVGVARPVARANEDAYRNVSRITRGWNHQHAQDGKIFEILHFFTPCSHPRNLPQTPPDLKNLQVPRRIWQHLPLCDGCCPLKVACLEPFDLGEGKRPSSGDYALPHAFFVFSREQILRASPGDICPGAYGVPG